MLRLTDASLLRADENAFTTICTAGEPAAGPRLPLSPPALCAFVSSKPAVGSSGCPVHNGPLAVTLRCRTVSCGTEQNGRPRRPRRCGHRILWRTEAANRADPLEGPPGQHGSTTALLGLRA